MTVYVVKDGKILICIYATKEAAEEAVAKWREKVPEGDWSWEGWRVRP